jgi:hypothetical protein
LLFEVTSFGWSAQSSVESVGGFSFGSFGEARSADQIIAWAVSPRED